LYNNKGKRIYTSYSNESKVYKIFTTKSNISTSFNNVTCHNIEDATNDSYLNLWHRRFGHFNIDLIKNKLKKINSIPKCKICLKSKLINLPYYPSINHTKEPFELLHMDLVKAPDFSFYNNRYFVTILDDFTRYSWVLFVKNKSDVYNAFIIWYNQIKNIFKNYNIKYIKTDNGTEFFNNNFNEFYNKTGIIHEHTVPHNPQQNGRVERLHRTLISNGDAMLADAKLSHKFWQDAVATANYIHNRLPHKGNNNKIPYELLYNEKVDYNRLKVFGCLVYFYVPKQFRKKFCNTTLPGVFLGYDEINHTAYRIYDINNNKIILSRTVAFLEDEPANIGPPLSFPDIFNFTPFYESEEIEDDINDNNNNEYHEVYNINNNNNNLFNNENQINLNNNLNQMNVPYNNINNLNQMNVPYNNLNNLNQNNFNNINNLSQNNSIGLIRYNSNFENNNKNFSNYNLNYRFNNLHSNHEFNDSSLNLNYNNKNNLTEINENNNNNIYFQKENNINFHNGNKENYSTNNLIKINNLNDLNLNNNLNQNLGSKVTESNGNKITNMKTNEDVTGINKQDFNYKNIQDLETHNNYINKNNLIIEGNKNNLSNSNLSNNVNNEYFDLNNYNSNDNFTNNKNNNINNNIETNDVNNLNVSNKNVNSINYNLNQNLIEENKNNVNKENDVNKEDINDKNNLNEQNKYNKENNSEFFNELIEELNKGKFNNNNLNEKHSLRSEYNYIIIKNLLIIIIKIT